MNRRARLLVLLSGSGRTLENLLARAQAGSLPAVVSCVVADRACRGLEIARSRGIPAELIPARITPERFDALVREHRIDWTVLAGYLRLVPITPVTRGRIVNIHPSLLPLFGGPGMHGQRVHQAVLDAARRGEVHESGCTVHHADERYDTGAVILQRRCPVGADDTPTTLADRVFALELDALPDALGMLIAEHTPEPQAPHRTGGMSR